MNIIRRIQFTFDVVNFLWIRITPIFKNLNSFILDRDTYSWKLTLWQKVIYLRVIHMELHISRSSRAKLDLLHDIPKIRRYVYESDNNAV